MATFLTDMMTKGYSQDEVLAVIFESEREKKRREMLAIVSKTVDAHRLEKMREILAYEKLATSRRINGFDRDVDCVYDRRSLPPTPPQEFCASLRLELQKLKDAISIPAVNTVTRPWQKTMDFVDGFKGEPPDEELAVFKWYVDKRSRDATQAQVAVTPDDAVQHCSPCSPNPDNHHQLVRVLKRPDSSVPRTRGRGIKEELPPPASRPRAWVQTKGEVFLHPRNERRTRKRLQTYLRQLRPQKTAGTRQLAKITSCLTPVEKERRHRLGTRL